MSVTETNWAITFRGDLRPSQREVVEIARQRLETGAKKLHVVAPPGSGKTVLGLFLWAHHVRRPALVLSPNSAIQAQWAARTDLFSVACDREELVSTDPKRPALLTSLTYQSVTLPRRGDEDLDELAREVWIDRLVERGQANSPTEAEIWIADLKRHNPAYYEERLSIYRKYVRDEQARNGNALDLLHASAAATLDRLRNREVGLVIFDECHHFMGHWGRVLAEASGLLNDPIVIGLTATPPDRTGKTPEDIARYDAFFGPIDYQVPVPSIVKDGYLAPYQDLAYFVRPTSDELSFVAMADEHLNDLVARLCDPATFAPPADEAKADIHEPPLADEACNDDHDSGCDAPIENGACEAIEPDATGAESSDPAEPNHGSAAIIPPAEPLDTWLFRTLTEYRLPTGVMKNWKSFERRDPEFATAARVFLLARGVILPEEIPPPEIDTEPDDVPPMNVLVPILDRFVRHRLRRSARPDERELADKTVAILRTLGIQITETGCQACASPVGRVMAYSRSKTEALAPILKAERAALGDAIRAVIVADYEKSSAVTAEIAHLLDHEAGGAVAAFKALLRDPEADALNPILLTGSSVLVDDDLHARFVAEAEAWLKNNGCDVELTFDEQDGFHVVNGTGAEWCPRVYVAMMTDLFQRGVTRCLVGTRGLLGEGWDATTINVLIDLTTVTTSMSVNQLRGRSIRLDPNAPDKLANNWDVVCVSPEFSQGLDDYQRFIRKHETLYGITDGAAVEKGVGHVHPAFTDLKPEGIEDSLQLLNADMLERADRRAHVRELWQIGKPFEGRTLHVLETCPISERQAGGLPPFRALKSPWTSDSLTLAVGQAVLGALYEAKLVKAYADPHVTPRAGGYVRTFLENADPEDSARFTTALREVLGPLRNPRYVIPRHTDRISETWLSKLLPSVVGQYFRQRKRSLVLLHAVPAALSKQKHLVRIFQRYWNAHVSPGEAVYAHHGKGEQLIARARRNGQVSRGKVHEKEIFV